MEVSDGQGSSQGRAGQEGQAQEGQPRSLTPIFDELAFGREEVLMSSTESPKPAPLCIVCKTPEELHGSLQHAFTPQGSRVDTSQFARKRPQGDAQGDDARGNVRGAYNVTQTPFDPVLRQALITKGILTVQDLADAEKMINALTNQISSAPRPANYRSHG